MARRAVRRARGGSLDGLHERLRRHGRPAWRHRRAAIAAAWLLCLIGWSGTLLLPVGPAPLPAAVSPAVADERPSPAVADPRPIHAGRDRATALRADLDDALALRAALARQLAEIPRLLDAGPNPIHQRRALQIGQQDALIATLSRRLVDLQMPVGDPSWLPQSSRHGTARLDPAPPTADPTVASTPVGRVPIAGVPRFVALLGVLVVASLGGAALAFWRGRHDGIIDHPGQLQHHAAPPVLCSITLPGGAAQERQERAGSKRAALACLGLLGLLVTLLVADRLGALAPPGESLPGGWRY